VPRPHDPSSNVWGLGFLISTVNTWINYHKTLIENLNNIIIAGSRDTGSVTESKNAFSDPCLLLIRDSALASFC